MNITLVETYDLVELQTSIFEPSSVTFFEALNAYITADIMTSKSTNPSWCVKQSFIINPVTQTKQRFSFQAGVAEQNLAITPFLATPSCGTFQWYYSGFDAYDGHSLNYTKDLIAVDQATGSIKVALEKMVGIYQIRVTGILPDYLPSTYSQVFTIEIKKNSMLRFSHYINITAS